MATATLPDEPVLDVGVDLPKGYELVDGELVEIPPMASESSWVAGRLFSFLDRHCQQARFGVPVSMESSFQCFPLEPGLVRKPDIAVILADPSMFVPAKKHYKEAPAILIEVASPGNTSKELLGKVEEFLRAGTQLAWVVEPELRVVLIHRADGTVTKLREPAELSGENVLPGFSVKLSDFLPPVPAKT